MSYCSVICQREDWREFHKRECAIIIEMSKIKLEVSSAIHNLIRMCIKYQYSKKIAQTTWTLYDGTQRSINDLNSRTPKAWNSQLTVVAKCLNDFGIVVDEFTVKYRAGQLLVNLLGVTNDMWFLKREDPMIAGGLYIELSAFDHSCRPNAICVFDGPVVTVRALRDIDTEKGSITICYLEGVLMRPRESRRDHIRTFCHFDCQCEVCMDPSCSDDDRNEFLNLAVPLFEAMADENIDKVNNIFNRKFHLIQSVLGRYSKTWVEFMILYMEFKCDQRRKQDKRPALSNVSQTCVEDANEWKRFQLSLQTTHGTEHPLYEVGLQFGKIISPADMLLMTGTAENPEIVK